MTASMPPPPPVAEEVTELQLPQVSLLAESARLVWGLSVRYGIACSVWYGIYRLKDTLQRKTDEESTTHRRAQVKMWMSSFAADMGFSLLLAPGSYLTGRNSQRLLFDFAFNSFGGALSKFDFFMGQTYLAYAINRLTSNRGGADSYVFLWQVPSTILTAAKLFLRWKEPRNRPVTNRCLVVGGMAAHFFVRVMVLSLSLYLPRSEEELILAGVMCMIDKSLEAFLLRNTYPYPGELEVPKAQP